MSQESAGEKTEQATHRRKTDARKKGTVAKSPDLTGALGLLTVSLISPTVFGGLASNMLGGMAAGVSRIPSSVTFGDLMRYGMAILTPSLMAVGPLFAALMVVGLASNFAQVGFVMSAEGLNPTMDKLNPLPGIKRLFSIKSSFEGFKAVAKMLVFGLIAFNSLKAEWSQLVGLSWLTPAQAATFVGGLTHTILQRIAIVWLIIAVADYIFQKRQIDKQLMMTKDELRREMKEQEGSPEVKQAQYQKRRKLAKGGLGTKLKQADVIVTNPTHFAVAIKYDRSTMYAPMVIAKGQDYLAQRIKQMAKEMNVPTVENKPLARALYKQCEAGDYVPRDLFAPVAEVLAYVYQTMKRVKR